MYGIINQSTDDINALLLKAGLVSNPNLLINPDFKINQRGLTEYTSENSYTVDMWRMVKGIINTTDTGIRFRNRVVSGDFSNFRQFIPNFLELTGKTLTLSINVTSIVGELFMQFQGIVSSGSEKNFVFKQITETGIHTLTLENFDSTDLTKFYVRIGNYANAVDANINWVKLEEGSIATPFQVPDETLELLKCQAYFYKPQNVYAGNVLICKNGTGLVGGIRFPVKMKTVPSVVLKKVFRNVTVTEITSANQSVYIEGLTSFYNITPSLVDGVYYQVEYEVSCELT